MTAILLMTAAVLFVVLLLLVRVDLLLPIGLAVTALVPIGWTGLPEVVTVGSPGAVVVLVWAVRGGPRQSGVPKLVVVLALALLVWLTVGAITSISLVRSAGWSTSLVVLVLVPLLSRSLSEREVRRTTTTWIVLVVGLTGFGVVERLLESNPLYGTLFLSGEYPILQHWSSYRITTTLGHPLSNSLFFAIGVTLALGRYVHEGSRRSLLGAAFGLVGLLLTVSRGGLIAVAVGAAVVLSAPSTREDVGRSGHGTSRRRALGLLTLVAGGLMILASPEFQERQQSWSGIASAQQRGEIGPVVLRAAASMHWLGSGPGTSNGLLQALGTPEIVENSYYQLLLSLGLPGLSLFVGLIATVLCLGLQRRAGAAVGALAALCVAVGGFNWIEADRPSMLYLGLLAAMAISGRPTAVGSADGTGYAAEKVEPMKAKSRVIRGSEPCTNAELR
ncbi:O-antigen ligase family protein [Curtobacterium sp. ME26]|uniref:O-antigen ligase family protein n=1 Tax=Curtobacterium sp. ME26 TaxID=2744254 RepID=UPI0015F5EA71|nr:O-antigen ligase family protein [Curtobacterium sp. ME26]